MTVSPLLRRKKNLALDRTYPHPIAAVWEAWTRPDLLSHWWGPEGTSVEECRLDLRVGGEVYLVMVAGTAMGKYAGTRWPMAGTIRTLSPTTSLVYDARSWTEGHEAATTIEHVNDIRLSEIDGGTRVQLHVSITRIGPKAKMAAFGMRWGYQAHLDQLEKVLAARFP